MMRKAVFTVCFVLGLLSLGSCTKEYHCTCTYNNTVVYTIDLGVQYRSTAEATCGRFDSTLRGITWDCTLH